MRGWPLPRPTHAPADSSPLRDNRNDEAPKQKIVRALSPVVTLPWRWKRNCPTADASGVAVNAWSTGQRARGIALGHSDPRVLAARISPNAKGVFGRAKQKKTDWVVLVGVPGGKRPPLSALRQDRQGVGRSAVADETVLHSCGAVL